MAPQRRLAAIVVADVVGYTRLMERDDVQEAMESHNHPLAPAERLDLRIGINLGDVIVDGTDIAGDGVNVAARLEALAAPGGICVSSAVREQIHGDIGGRFIDIGEHRVKNHARPVHVYRVALTPAMPGTAFPPADFVPIKPWTRLTAATAAIALSIAGVVYVVFIPTNTVASVAGPPIASAAVMPFAPASESAGDADFAHLFTQDLTTALQRACRPARVVSYGLAAKYGARQVDPRSAGSALNVRYLVEGSVGGSSGSRVATLRMTETTGGAQLWSDQITLSQPDTPDGNRDVIVSRLANGLRSAIGRAEARRVSRLPASSSSAIDVVFRANDAWSRDHSLKGTLIARRAYEDALRLDPAFAPALIGLGYTYQWHRAGDGPSRGSRTGREANGRNIPSSGRCKSRRSRGMGAPHRCPGAARALG
jgi:TolB-like protein